MSVDWFRARQVFQEAFDRPDDEREAFLREACDGDEALIDEVRSLLAAHVAADGFLETAARFSPAHAPAAASSLTVGDRLGRYEVTGLLGAGGMGEVYRARDVKLGREVAIKLLPPAFAADPDRLARFERESRILASLKHPGIASIYSIEVVNGLRALVLELVEGPTLAERVAEGPVPLLDSLAIARQLADSLEAAHARGIVHRDLKPANVKFASGRVTLLDFGLAKAADTGNLPAPIASAETTPGMVLGTWAYMAPEQARGQPLDARADVWAFGCILFELLSGQAAFHADTPSETVAAVLERPPQWARLPDEVPPAVHRLLRRCLEKDPTRRLRDIADARLDLDDALQELEDLPRPAAPPNAAASRDPQARRDRESHADERPRRRVLLPALFATAALALGWLAHAWLAPAGRPSGTSGSAGDAIASLAILPFENRSRDQDAAYLGDELAENLIEQMSRLPTLKVMARGTTSRFKGSTDPRGAGQALGVGAVLTGTVDRRGDRLVVRVELLDVRSGERLWGDRLDRPFAEIVQLQGSMAAGIAGGLRLELSPQERQALGGAPTANTAAFELAMKARHLLLSNSEDDDFEARRLYEQAAALDPNFIDAHLGIASVYLRSAAQGYSPPGETMRRAGDAAGRALAIDPDNVRARSIRGVLLYQQDWNWPAAEREIRGVSADPRLLLGNQYHGPAMFFWAIGRSDESVALLERALKTDPGNLESRIMLCDFLHENGRLDRAAQCYRSLEEAAPSDPRPLFGLAEVLRRRSDLPGAIETLRSAYEFSGDGEGFDRLAAARSEADYHAAEAAVARTRLADLQALAATRYVSPLDLARLHAQTGAREPAFAALARALEERSPMLVLLKVDRAWDGLRNDPRLLAAVRRVGIP